MSTREHSISLPPTDPAPRRRRRPAVYLGVGAAVLALGTAGAVAFGVSTASSLEQDVLSESVPGVRELVVGIDEGSLVLRAGAGPDVEIRTTRIWGPGYQPVVGTELVDGTLTVTSDCASFNLGCEVEQEIVVPAGTVVRASTVDGAIDAVGLDVPRFDATTVAGQVTASFSRVPEAIRAETVAGAVQLVVPPAAYRVDAGSVSGAVRVDVVDDPAAAAEIVVDTVAGAIEVRPS